VTSVAELLAYLTPEEQAELDALLDSPAVPSLREFAQVVNPKYRWYRHCEVLADALERVVTGEITRLMVFMPPRHGKSELASRIFPAYYLLRHPDRWVGLNSYAADLAQTFSRTVRDHYQQAGGVIRDDSGAVKHWETPQGGGMWAAGVGGPITGKGFHLGIIDDPIKNAEEANSEVIREKHRDWYRSTFYTREEPGGAVVVIQTRWHEDDLAGWLLTLEQDDEPERWHVVNLAAVAEAPDERPVFPTTCTVEPDWRTPGQALCPERYDVPKLQQLKSKVGSYYFGALYQQRPTSAAGDVFKRAWWKFYTTPEHPIPGVAVLPPRFDRVIQSWDMAFKDEETSDFVAGQVWGAQGTRCYLLDRVKERMSFTASCAAVVGMTAKWPKSRGKYIEDKANGPAIINALRRTVHGVVPVKPDGGKVARAFAVQPMVEAGQVYLPHPSIAPWVEDFIRELAAFPRGSHDDDVDACTQALNVLSRGMRDNQHEPDEDDPTAPVEMPFAEHHARMSRVRSLKERREQPAYDPDFGAF
jgi:predicted phage terminase large subunit-like protein